MHARAAPRTWATVKETGPRFRDVIVVVARSSPPGPPRTPRSRRTMPLAAQCAPDHEPNPAPRARTDDSEPRITELDS